MPDQWDEFADAEPASNDEWAEFADAPQSKKARSRRRTARPDSLSTDTITRAVDGDTYRLKSDRSLRVWGIDAPELKQQGWNRQGEAVPIGQQARAALDQITIPWNALMGPEVGNSWGRPVAPVTVDGADVGQAMLRGGNALAAPTYLGSDPQRRSNYMQAERLARLNRLGVHDTYFQPPEEYRRDPHLVIPRETVAQFFDTPTPFAGLRPEDEQEYLRQLNDYSIPPEKVAEWVKERGFTIDPEDVRNGRIRAEKTKQTIGFDYVKPPEALTDLGDGATGAAIRGFGNGVVPQLLDELGAVPDSLGLTPDRENVFNSDRRWADIWSNNQQQNSSILGYDAYAHPYASFGGELAGGLVLPFGARAKTATDLAKVGGAYGFVGGFGAGEGSVTDRLPSAFIGTGLGIVGGVGLGKAMQAAEPYVGRVVGRLTGKGSEGVPEGEMGASGQGMMAMDAEPAPSLSAPMREPDRIDVQTPRPQPLDAPISDAQRAAIAERITPDDVLPIPSNMVADVEEAAARDAGRIIPASPVNERGELERQTVRAWNGAEVPKLGPVDMVGWLRLNGGLADQGGELAHMGMNNAARRGMDFVGQEQRFGPLVNEAGMSLDDAAQRAWEAGYFPDHTERPSINEFLDSLRETYEGRNRAFLPDDLAQIDRYYGAQSDRMDLEQRLQDGPVWQDRSSPAEEPQPLPPVSAYEEWPEGGPDFAGNINLSKLDSPQDISRALAQTERRVGFDAATRGRVTQAETEQLASELGMTADDLLSRRKGQALNAEEALAARQILAKSGNELVNAARRVRSLDNPGDDVMADFRQKWMRHVAIQEQVAGATAEAGRALAQFRMAANSRAARGDVLASMVRGGGGRDNLKEVADVLLDAAETAPGKFNVLSNQLKKPKWHNRAAELYINALLSWPQTHAVNITSNTLTTLAQIPEHVAASAIGGVRQFATGKAVDRVIGSEVGARAFGLIQGAKEGARMFARALKTGEASDFASKIEGEEFKAIPGKLGEVVRTPTRLLTAEDELFKGIARRMELNGMAVRIAHREGLKGEAAKARIAELSANPADEMLDRALDYGRYLTFQRPLGDFASKVSAITNVPSGLGFFAKLNLPFVRTPSNLLKFAVERSPAAPMLKEWRADFKAGGARRDLAVARALVGTGFGALMVEAAQSGLITGSVPSDPKKAKLLLADGWKPYSVKIGDTYYSYKRLDPFSTTIGVAADMATLPEGMSERQQDDKATLLVASIMGNLASKTWLSGVSSLTEALREPDRYAGNFLQQLVGSFLVPNLVAGTARTMDPTQRRVETMGDALQSRIPGLRDDLLPRRDIWGRPIVNSGGIGPDFLSPVWVSEALKDPVNHELMQTDYAPGTLSKKVGGRELTPEEYDRYQEVAGALSHARLTELVTAPEWKALDSEQKADAARKVVAQARREARATLFDGDASGASVPNVPKGAGRDEWSEFQDAPTQSQPGPVENDEWAEFADPEQRDVLGNLSRNIPGVRFTSGYRTPAYQAKLKARGYHPSNRSSHLDGSGIDMLPPPGKSLGWLKKQVMRLEPDARLLIHDGHLHASIPGWYGAPVLGGAKGAGLKNPMEGVPPPPPGFTLNGR